MGRLSNAYFPSRAAQSFLCALICALLCALSSCSTKKNTPASRQWQAFNTRYNVYFNGDQHYQETLRELEAKYEDDYSRTMLLHPSEARSDARRPQPQGDFKRTIEKMQKAIQLHSIKKKPAKKSGSPKEKAFRAREEFNPFLHNAWLMLGKGQYHNGDFLGAASTFFYISKHFTWLPAVVTEARLWQARSYCALGWGYEAENILHLVKKKDLTSKSLQRLYDLVQADWLVGQRRWADAVPFLARAAAAASGSQKNRLYFLLGQLYADLGRKSDAYAAFAKAGSGPSTPYRTKFNARIKQSEVFTGSNIRKEVGALRAMTRYERNKEYLDQIYYAIANLYLSRRDTAEARKNYILAVEKSTRQGIDKALANLALGNIYFDQGHYTKAQPCYAEAVPQLPDTYPGYKTLRRRSDVLDELSLYAGNVELQDSLLRLADLPPEEQLKVCERLAGELKKKEKEEAEAARKEAYMAEQADRNPDPMGQNQSTPSFQLAGDKSWYFYNAAAKQAGKTEFQRRWGARRLEDDWRRRNKTTFAFDDPEPDSEAEGSDPQAPADSISPEQKQMLDREADPHFAEYYLRQIPNTPEERRVAEDVIQEGLYNMGIILKDRLEDFKAARQEFMRLDSRFPDNIYRLDVYYNMYLMDVRQDRADDAARWRDRIIADFPDSPYGSAMRDPDYFDNLRRMNEIQEQTYERTYRAYLDDRNAEVHSLTKDMEKEFPLSKILPKFLFIDALSYLTEKDYTAFRERLTELLDRYPDTDMTDMAGGILRGLKAGREPHAGVANSRGMIWEMRLSNDSTSVGADGQPANFERDPASPQYVVLAFDRDSVSANQLLFDVARFNFSSFTVRDFDLEPMSFGSVGLIVVKGLANLREAEYYRDMMARAEAPDGEPLFGPDVRPIIISRPNFELLLREGRSFEEYFRFEQQADIEQTEEELLGPGMTMPSPEDPLPDDVFPDDTPPQAPLPDPSQSHQ